MIDKLDINEYIKLYNNGYPLDRMKPVQTQTDKIFRLSKVDIRVVERSMVYSNPEAYKKLAHFIQYNQYFYMVPITTVRGTIVGFIVRGIFEKGYNTILRSFSSLEVQVPLMYGFDESFKKYDTYPKCCPIVVCEGCKDVMTLKKIYPYVLSNNRSSMGTNIKVLRNISDKFLLAYDNDEAGKKGMDKDKKTLRGMGAYVDTLVLPEGVKDCTDYLIPPVTGKVSKDNFDKLKQQVKSKLIKLYNI